MVIRQEQINQTQLSRDNGYKRTLIHFYRKNFGIVAKRLNDEQSYRRVIDAVTLSVN